MSTDYGSSTFVVSTGATTAGLSRSPILKLYGTMVWQNFSYARWDEKYSMIKAAYATDSYIYIYSSDGNCSGNQDEFKIIVCQTEEDCKS